MSSSKFGKRILKIRKDLDVNQGVFAKEIGISQGTLSDIESGKTKPSADTLSSLCQYYPQYEHWLLTGEGPECRDNAKETPNERPILKKDMDFEQSLEQIKWVSTWVQAIGFDPKEVSMELVQEDAMEPTLRHGEIVLIKKTSKLEDDGVYAILVNNEKKIRRLQKMLDQIAVLTDNPQYEPLYIETKDFKKTVTVLGKIVQVGKKI